MSSGPLDTHARCNDCGGRLDDDRVDECPHCRSRLAEVGITPSELAAWGVTRQSGAFNHIFPRAVYGWGGVNAAAGVLGQLWKNGAVDWTWITIMFVLAVFIGAIVEVWRWRAAERQYVAAVPAPGDGLPRE